MSIAIILDDLQERHDWFSKVFGATFQIFHTYNFTQFFDIITKYPGHIDYISLDHDLGDISDFNDKMLYGTGMLAVNLLNILPEHMRPAEVNVHSANSICAPLMKERLISIGGYKIVTDMKFE